MCDRNRNRIIQPPNDNAKLLVSATTNYSLQPAVAIVHHEWLACTHQSTSRLKDKQTCTRYENSTWSTCACAQLLDYLGLPNTELQREEL